MSGARPFIVVGDKTDHGGEVLEGSPKALINGKMIARMGDKVHCPRCRGTQTIVEGDPSVIVDGKPAAFHGAKTSCGAVLIASMMDNTIGGPPEPPLPPERDWSVPPQADPSSVSEFSWEALEAWPNKYVPPTTAADGGNAPAEATASHAQERKISRDYLEQARQLATAVKTHGGGFTGDQVFGALYRKPPLEIVRDGNTVTLKARIPVWDEAGPKGRADNFAHAAQSLWDGLSYTDKDGTIYKTDVKLYAVTDSKQSAVRLYWRNQHRERSRPDGQIVLDVSERDSVIDPRMAAHELGHAYFGLQDRYFDGIKINLPDGTTYEARANDYQYLGITGGSIPMVGFEHNLMGVGTEISGPHLKELVLSYQKEISRLTSGEQQR